MEPVATYEINDRNESQKILIATQGSEYKNDVVKDVVESLRGKTAYIKVIDVSLLQDVQPDQWNAIVVLHTWEIWKPEENARVFLKKYYSSEKIFVVTTSGSGEEKIEGVDAITGASILKDVPRHSRGIISWLELQLPPE